MTDEISDDDLRTLLSSAGDRSPSSNPSDAFAQTPMAYDFKRPQRVNKDQIRIIENIHEQFARLFSSTLASSMRMVVDADTAFTDQVLYNEFILSLPNPCSAYSFVMSPPEGPAVLSFSPELLMAIIDRAFGGRGTGLTGDARPLTPIEINVVSKLVSRIFHDLEATWELTTPVQISEVVLETNPEFIQIAGSGDPVMLIAFEANSNHVSGLIHLCYPLTTLEPLLPKITEQHRFMGRRPSPEDIQNRSRAFNKTKVPVAVHLAHGTLPLKELSGLQQGDVIKLDTTKDQPAVVFLGNQPKFLARPGLDGRKRAVKIIEVIAEDDEELYR